MGEWSALVPKSSTHSMATRSPPCCERRTKPLPLSTSPRVTRGQSLRCSLKWPRWALGLAAASPSKQVLVRS